MPDDWSAEDEALLQGIDDATATPILISYKLANEWFDGLHAVVDDLEPVVTRRPRIGLDLIEHALSRLNQAAGGVDDSNGGMAEVFGRLEPLHARAAAAAGVNPAELARRLIEFAGALETEVFGSAVTTHGDVLGTAGLEVLITEAERYRGDDAHRALLDHLVLAARAALDRG